MGITNDELATLKQRSRKRFTDAYIEDALKYQYDHPDLTLEEVADKFNMTSQTLGFRRDKLLRERGIKVTAEQVTAPIEVVQESPKAETKAKSTSKKKR